MNSLFRRANELNIGSSILTRRGGTDANAPESPRKAIIRDWHVGILASQVLENVPKINTKLYEHVFPYTYIYIFFFSSTNLRFACVSKNETKHIAAGEAKNPPRPELDIHRSYDICFHCFLWTHILTLFLSTICTCLGVLLGFQGPICVSCFWVRLTYSWCFYCFGGPIYLTCSWVRFAHASVFC